MLLSLLDHLLAIDRKHLFIAVIASATWFLYTALKYRRVSKASPVPWTLFDSTLMSFVALWGAVTVLFLVIVPPMRIPAEDPTILFQFSRNLANTGAITYIPHGPHAEGATDFAWMVLIAAGIKLHMDPRWTVSIINLASLFGLPYLLTRIANQRLTAVAALTIVGAYGLLPQAAASVVGFSVLPFGCLLVLVVLCFVRRQYFGLSLSCLLLCLFRPDGVVFAVPIQIAALLVHPDRRRIANAIAGCFVFPGLVYFFWRWHYFHSLLPLPFLVKSDAQRFAHFFVTDSVEGGLFLCFFAFTLSWIALRGRGKLLPSSRAVLLCILLLPNLFYFAMRLDQNAGHRFFVYLPIGAAVITAMEWPRLRADRAVVLRSWIALWVVFVCGMSLNADTGAKDDQADNRAAIAKDLSGLPHGTLIVTEAGILPYYSGWSAYDAWGLNTAEFAHRLFQPTDVASVHPDAMLVYTGASQECTRESVWATPYTKRTWQHLTRNMVAGAGSDYELWYAPFGSIRQRNSYGVKSWQGLQECWFLRRSSPLLGPMQQVLVHHGALPAAQYLAILKNELAAGRTPDTLPNILRDAQSAPGPVPPPQERDLLHILAHRPYRIWLMFSQ